MAVDVIQFRFHQKRISVLRIDRGKQIGTKAR